MSTFRAPALVSLIPAHDSYGVVSMRRYLELLTSEWRESDRYHFHQLHTPRRDQAAGKIVRHLSRRFLYPPRVRFGTRGAIAHVLDQSWADLLPRVPAGIAKVVTVHDLIPLRDSASLTGAQLGRFRSWVSHLTKADLLISVSDYTKREIVSLLGVPPEKIVVVPNGVELPRENAPIPERISRAVASAAGRLVVGSLGSTLTRKNLRIFPEALARFQSETGRQICLLRGGMLLPEPLRESIRQALGADSLIELGPLTDNELDGFYKASDVVVVPSTFEGFGLPVLEAMARGTPVLSSSSSSLPEVGGDAALYFDPSKPEELAFRLASLVDEEVRTNLGEAGRRRVAHYSWRESLEGVYAAYDQVVRTRGS